MPIKIRRLGVPNMPGDETSTGTSGITNSNHEISRINTPKWDGVRRQEIYTHINCIRGASKGRGVKNK